MLKNHLLVAFRSLTKQKFYSAINIFGLSVGLTAALLIGLFIQHEWSYDNFHQYGNRIVKANLSYGENEQSAKQMDVSPDILLTTFQREFPEIIGGVRVFNPSGFRPTVLKIRDQLFEERNFMYADSTFYSVFSFPLLEGNPNSVLAKPGMVVLSKSAALKYFPLHDPVGAEIEIDGSNFLISGIMQDAPDNASITPSMVASFSTHPGSRRNTWGSANYHTYFLLEQGIHLENLQAKVQPLMQRLGISEPEEGSYINFELIPLNRLHLYSAADSTSDIKYILIFSVIALLILSIAAINYMNLATAKSAGRAKEVGVRKSIGAFRSQLVSQFLVEALVLSFIATSLAVAMAVLLLPIFNELTGKAFIESHILNLNVLVVLSILSVGIGLMAGIYPALVLSLFKPADVLKGDFKSSSSGSLLRQILVVFQFGISVFLIVCTLVVGTQLRHVQSVKLGYERENIVVIPVNRQLINRGASFKSEIISKTAATDVTIAGETPAYIRGGYSLWSEGMPDGASIDVTAVAVDHDYIRTLKMNLIAGENISEQDRKRSEEGDYHFILNERALKELQIPLDQAIGKRVSMNGREGTIKGIVQDFHFRPLHQKISSLVLFPENHWSYNYAMVRVLDSSPAAIEHLRETWSALTPDTPFSYDFLDDSYNKLYRSEAQLGQIFSVFATVGIIIASLGLLGLVSFAAVQRAREIGIRKVLGASVTQVMQMMTVDFGKLIVVAFILAAPLAFVVMNSWLQSFEYRVEIGAGSIILAFVLASGIAVLSIGYQVMKAALSDPIDVLKDQ